jgi:hypothetical protein
MLEKQDDITMLEKQDDIDIDVGETGPDHYFLCASRLGEAPVDAQSAETKRQGAPARTLLVS